MNKTSVNWKDIDPEMIKEYLDRHIVGQDHAKKILSVAVYNHYKMMGCETEKTWLINPVTPEKSNILMLGPTGVGKTALIKALADVIQVPFVTCDATSMTEAGYVGAEPESCIQRLLMAADGDTTKAETGIVYIDEIDKLAVKDDTSSSRDVGGEGVQQALLKIIEGTCVDVAEKERTREDPFPKKVSVDTSRILFIVGGAFVGIEDIIRSRVEKKAETARPMGFCLNSNAAEVKAPMSYNELIDNVTPEDIRRFGIIPELLGRLPVIAPLHELNVEDLYRILTEPQNALVKQYREIFRYDNVELQFSEGALQAVADRAMRNGTGARGLRKILEDVLRDSMYFIKYYAKGEKLLITTRDIERAFGESGQAETALFASGKRQNKYLKAFKLPGNSLIAKISAKKYLYYKLVNKNVAIMNPKTKRALQRFQLHVKGSTEFHEALGGYNRKYVHLLADSWLSDIHDINASVVNDDDGRACLDVFWQVIDNQIRHEDYFSAKLLALGALPLIRRYNIFTLGEIYRFIDSRARDKGKNPFNKKYINFYELTEAVKRFVHAHVYGFATEIDLEFIYKMLPHWEAELCKEV